MSVLTKLSVLSNDNKPEVVEARLGTQAGYARAKNRVKIHSDFAKHHRAQAKAAKAAGNHRLYRRHAAAFHAHVSARLQNQNLAKSFRKASKDKRHMPKLNNQKKMTAKSTQLAKRLSGSLAKTAANNMKQKEIVNMASIELATVNEAQKHENLAQHHWARQQFHKNKAEFYGKANKNSNSKISAHTIAARAHGDIAEGHAQLASMHRNKFAAD